MLGTVVEVVIVGGTTTNARLVAAVVIAEIERLESVLSAFDAGSELSAWKRDELKEPSREFSTVMAAALDWQQRSGGSFNPLTGELSAIWSAAERIGVRPSPGALAQAAAAISVPRYEMRDGAPVRLGDCRQLNLNAIAKGYIVDRALGAAQLGDGVVSVLVSAGGDLAHRGVAPSRVGIENPLRPYDNEPPLAFVELSNAGLATSGGSRRSIRIDGQRFSHVLDPRTGEPVDTHASISILAPSATEADALTTVVGALAAVDAVDLVETMPHVGCLIVEATGRMVCDSTWERYAGASRD